MGYLARLGRTEIPHCPICEGPCQCEFPRSPYAFPDRLPKEPPERMHDPPPPPVVKVNPRGKRMVKGPQEDRMIRGPEDDRDDPA